MVFRSCCNVCSTRTFPENGRTHNPSHWTHGVVRRGASTRGGPCLRGKGGCSGTCPGRMGTWDHQGAPGQRPAEGSYSWGVTFHPWLQEGDLFQIRQPAKLDISLKKVTRNAGVRLCNLKRRAGFDASILPPKRAALSGAERVSKVNNVANWRCFWCCFVLALHTYTCLLSTARTNYFQARQQEDDVQREDRLAQDRDHRARVWDLLLFFSYASQTGAQENKLFSGSTTRRWCTARGSPFWPDGSPSSGQSCCCLAWSNRFQVRDQEDAEHRDVRLATDRDRHALVRDLFTVYNHVFVRICQPSWMILHYLKNNL